MDISGSPSPRPAHRDHLTDEEPMASEIELLAQAAVQPCRGSTHDGSAGLFGRHRFPGHGDRIRVAVAIDCSHRLDEAPHERTILTGHEAHRERATVRDELRSQRVTLN